MISYYELLKFFDEQLYNVNKIFIYLFTFLCIKDILNIPNYGR